MTNYEEVRVKLKTSQISKLKSAEKAKTTLRKTRKTFTIRNTLIIVDNKTENQNKKCFI